MIPEDLSLLDRCPHFKGCYAQTSMELEPEDASIRHVSPFRRVLVHMVKLGIEYSLNTVLKGPS